MKKTGFILALAFIIAFNGVCLAAQKSKNNSKQETYTEEAQSNTEIAQNLSNSASAKFYSGNISGAISDLDRAIQTVSDNPKYFLNRGYIKHVIGDLEGALNDYNSAINLSPNYAYAYNNRGVLKVALNDTEGAMADYEKALKINPKYADVYYNRGNLKYMLDDNQGALEDYDNAIKFNPKDSDAYNNRGVVKKRMNFNVGALSDYSQAIALNPKDSIAHANRGHLKKLYFDNEGAAIDLDQAVALAENQAFIKNVKPLLSNERYIAAIPTVKNVKVAHNEQKQVQPQERIAQASVKEENIKPVNMQKPKPQTVTQKPVQVPENTGNSNPAKGVLKAGVGTVKAKEPPVTTTQITNTPTTNVKLAESYYIRGLQKCILKDLNGAMADLDKAIANNSKYADAYFYRAAIKKELGDSEGFRKDYSTAIQIDPKLQQYNDVNGLSMING